MALDRDQYEAIMLSMSVVAPYERYGLSYPRVGEDTSPMLTLKARSLSRADAEEVLSAYRLARELAGSPEARAYPRRSLTAFAGAPHARSLEEAWEHVASERYEWAVARSQTACEMYARIALDRIARDLSKVGKDAYRLLSREQAETSLDAAQSFVGFLQRRWAAAGGDLGQPVVIVEALPRNSDVTLLEDFPLARSPFGNNRQSQAPHTPRSMAGCPHG
jgi:hypothetical protein